MRYTLCFTFVLAIAIAAILSNSAPAGPGGGGTQYEITWHSIDTGGGTAVGGGYEISGTIGQHDAGGPLVAGQYALNGGYWSAGGVDVPTCPADLSGDNVVDVADLLQVLADWGTPNSDIDGDNTTGVSDLLAVLAAWGACP